MSFDEVYWYDPGDTRCKTPYGAVPGGRTVTFTLRPRRYEAFARGELIARWEFDGNRITRVSMPWTGLYRDRDLFSCDLELGAYVGLVWYSFRLERFDGSAEETEEYQLTVYDGREEVPSWFGEGVTYQIFPDRFHRLSVPDPTGMVGGRWVHRDWAEEPVWRPNEHGEIRNRDFFGGSLPGITEKLPYLYDLGVETIYLCPIFEAPENHRYGCADYEKIDPMLGTKEDFELLCRKAHALGMRIMLDGVFNHTAFVSKYFNGDGFYPGLGAFQSRESPYYGWFSFQNWPYQYTSWWGIYSLPTTNKGNREWLEYITGKNGVIRSWLRAGADGWRLDVADELPDFVVRAIHAAARAEKKDSVIIGEVWEDASNKIAYNVRRYHVLGGHCDGVMNYPLRSALLDYLLGAGGERFRQVVEQQRQNYPRWAFYSGMNSLGTHDVARAVTVLGMEGGCGAYAREWRARHMLNECQRALGEARLRLGALLLYALPGSPTVYYGDEIGMEGFEDPFNRRTFPWGRENNALHDWFAALGRARKSCPALRRGELEWLRCGGPVVAFTRTLDGETVAACANSGEDTVSVDLPGGTAAELPRLSGMLLRRAGKSWVSLL